MCGIAGYCLSPKHYASVDVNEIAGQMLIDIQHRGEHATGAAWVDPRTGKRNIIKAPIPALKFVRKAGNKLCNNAQTAILHTRFATQGSPTVEANNHPIPRGKIVLTHNGHVSNDDELFKQLGVSRVGQVDSEALAALVAFGKGKPWEILTQVQGTAALAWISANDSRTLHLARVNSSPLWLAQSNTGSLFYGSTLETIENAAIMSDCDLDWTYEAKEGEYFRVRDGRVSDYQRFTPQPYVPYKMYSSYDSHWLRSWGLEDTSLQDERHLQELDYQGRYNARRAEKYADAWGGQDIVGF